MNKIINFDYLIKRSKYRNPNKKTLQFPCRGILFGPSGCGKTSVVLNLLLNPLTKMEYDKVFLYAKQLDEPFYEALIQKFEKIEKKLSRKTGAPIKILHYCNSLEGVLPLDDMDRTRQNLIIFDDFMTEKNQDIILEYWIRGRKCGCSTLLLSQSFYSIDKDVRGNSNYLI